MNRVVHFDIYADDPEKASEFYKKAFDWKFEKWEGGDAMEYWLIMTGAEGEPGINGGMSRRKGGGSKRKSDGSITIGVADIDAAIGKVEKAGGKITMVKTPIPEVGWFANFKDPEGNALSMMQTDMSAK
jgi:uncharacterized protein